MAGSMNKVILVGNLAADPEIRTTQDGAKVANMTVATSKSWKDKNGERQEKAQFHRVTVWNPRIVEYVESFLQKGRKVSVVGELEYRKWTRQDGQDVLSAEVVLGRFDGEVEALSAPPSGDAAQAGSRSNNAGTKAAGAPRGNRNTAKQTRDEDEVAHHGVSAGADLDDEIPF